MADILGLADAMFGISVSDAKAQGICVRCKQHVYLGQVGDGEGCIYTTAGMKEYAISGICEHCFDKIFE